MKICIDCFNDKELKAVAEGLKIKGKCDVCGKEAHVYDTQLSDGIVDIIDDFMNMYKPANEEVKGKNRLNLENELINHWKVFSKSCVYKVKNIIKAIYEHSPETQERFDVNLFDNDVYIPQTVEKEYLMENAILKNHDWSDFTYGIKHKNRYHSSILNKERLDDFLEPLSIDIPAKTKFYRARISNKEGFKSKEMGMPPLENSRSGRIGAEGIPCFYLANDGDTAIKEVRAGAFDYVTIARFVCKKSIKVIDLRLLDNISPFSVSDPVLMAVNYEALIKIKEEVEKPVRVTENNIEYVPIQYICDYIRSKGYNGIIYNSTMSAKGFNLSAFSDEDFKYLDKSVCYVKDIEVYVDKKV